MGRLHATWLPCSNKLFHTAKQIWGRGNGEVIKTRYHLPLPHFSQSPFPRIFPSPRKFDFLFAMVLNTSRSWNRFFLIRKYFFPVTYFRNTPPQTLSAQRAAQMKEFYINKPSCYSVFWSWNLNYIYCVKGLHVLKQLICSNCSVKFSLTEYRISNNQNYFPALFL